MNIRKPLALLVVSLVVTLLPLAALAAEPPSPPAATPPATVVAPAPAATPAVVAPPVVAPVKQPEAAAKPIKIGYLDVSRVGQESELGKAVKAGLLKNKESLEAKVLAKRKQLDKLKQTLEGQFPTLNAKQREAKSKDFQKKVEAFQKLAQDTETEFNKLQESETNRVFGVIEKVVAEYGKGSDLSLIIVKKELLYLADGVDAQDVTDAVLKLVNQEGNKK